MSPFDEVLARNVEREKMLITIANLAFNLGIRPSELLKGSVDDLMFDLLLARLYFRELNRRQREEER